MGCDAQGPGAAGVRCRLCWQVETRDAPHRTTRDCTQVITVNQVVDILARLQAQPDWRAVLEAVLPGRKKAGEGGGSRSQSPAAVAAAAATAGATSDEQPAGQDEGTQQQQQQQLQQLHEPLAQH
jgi:hypothetical protein